MMPQQRLKLEELGPLEETGCEALTGVSADGAELAAFLNAQTESPTSEGWPSFRGQTVNKVLFPLLCSQTQDHCSFCDGHPMTDAMTSETIEHFCPKSGPHARPELRLVWENLYACCSGCQTAKREKWDPALLRPDEPGYSFRRYFSCEFTTGRIVPRRRASASDRHRAQVTIDLYDLNRCAGHRRDMFTLHPMYGQTVPLEKKPFRYWAEAVDRTKAAE
jgi:uncharacterized protein (TIGR02646 family)